MNERVDEALRELNRITGVTAEFIPGPEGDVPPADEEVRNDVRIEFLADTEQNRNAVREVYRELSHDAELKTDGHGRDTWMLVFPQ